MRTLLLDNTYYPVKVISWKQAMILWVTGRAEVVDVYSDIQIRSPRESFSLPKTLRLFSRHKSCDHIRFTRLNVFMRDDFTCQYCGMKGSTRDLTFDHIIPRSKGGRTNWENIVTACHPCNGKKGDKLPRDVGMKLAKKPGRPRWSPVIILRLKEDDPVEWWSWVPATYRKAS